MNELMQQTGARPASLTGNPPADDVRRIGAEMGCSISYSHRFAKVPDQ